MNMVKELNEASFYYHNFVFVLTHHVKEYVIKHYWLSMLSVCLQIAALYDIILIMCIMGIN